jgi:hypothetical protein
VGDEPGCEQRFEVVAFLLALHGPGGVGVDEIDGFGGPGRPVLLAAHRDTVPGRHKATNEEAVSVPAPILAPLRRWMRVRCRVSMIRSTRRLTTR